MRRRDRETGGAWRSAAARYFMAVIVASAMSGCTGWPGPYASTRHVNKGNPFDYALWTFQWSAIVDVARDKLLKRYPIGTPTADLRRYLESVGASCTRKADGPLECRYSQYVLYGNRGIIGDEWRSYDHYDFTTRLWPGRGQVTKLTMCKAMVREFQRGPMLLGQSNYVRKSDFKPCV